MKSPGKVEDEIMHVTEIYVAVFPVQVNSDHMAEVVLAGLKKDPACPDMSQVRATVETHAKAVPDLVALCDEIIDNQAELDSYRLLKFDKNGIHILSPEDFRPSADFQMFNDSFMSVGWGES